MEIKVNVDKNGFKGWAVVDVRPFVERAQMLKELDLVVAEGEAKPSEQMDKIIKIQELTKKHVVKLELEFDGIKFKSIDELECYVEGQEVVTELSGYVLNGVRLSKN